MAFSKKTWKDRVSQYINRRLLTDSDGNTQQVTVTRDEGSVTEAGDAFSAANMNDLEDRIDNAFDGLTAADIPYSAGVSVADKLATIPTILTYTASGTVTVNAYNYADPNINVSKTGYKTLGMVGCYLSNTNVCLNGYYLQNDGAQLKLVIRNDTSTQQANINYTVVMLYVSL